MHTRVCGLLYTPVFYVIYIIYQLCSTVATLQMAGEGGGSVWDSPQGYSAPAEPYCSPRLQDTLLTIRYNSYTMPTIQGIPVVVYYVQYALQYTYIVRYTYTIPSYQYKVCLPLPSYTLQAPTAGLQVRVGSPNPLGLLTILPEALPVLPVIQVRF